MTQITIDNDGRDFLIYREGSGRTIEIFDIVVGSKRRQGRGKQLVTCLLESYMPKSTRRVWAITRATNWVAQQFYEALRFRSVPLRGFYGEDGDTVDAIMYIRDIGSLA